MDPLTAVSLAGTVVQFVDFSTKLLSVSTEFYKSSELPSNVALRQSAGEIKDLASTAVTDLQDYQFKLREGSVSATKKLSRDEEMLQELCRRCTEEADTLIELLNRLQVPETASYRRWKSLAQALCSIWSKKEIDGLMHKLQEYRSQVNSQVLISLGSRLDLIAVQTSDKFKSLASDNQAIISAILNLQAPFSEDLQVQLRTLSLLLNRIESVVTDQEDHTRKMIVDVFHQVLVSDQPERDRTPLERNRQFERQVRIEVSNEVLDSLKFPSMWARLEGVAEAHRNTFEWIFGKPRTILDNERQEGKPQHQWSDFTSWLQNGDGLYWINGKPASGKSTLMKFIITHATTAKSLSVWNAKSPEPLPLYIASFFFWASGTSLQKSQAGLLRSILYDVLQQNTDLIPVIFPKQWSARYLEKLSPSPSKRLQKDTWLLSGLKLAFRSLVHQNQIPLKMCLFIDGLDEYEGDSFELAKLFQEVSESPSIKLCVSSRPHLVFQEAFATRPSLRIQDLTRKDIKQFVQDELGDDERMRQLSSLEPNEAPKLVEEVVDAANGVFLWVKLVVDSLLRGLGEHDMVSDLQARLRILPKGLEELYSHIILKVDETYRAEAARLLTLKHEATYTRDDLVEDRYRAGHLTILAVSFAEDNKFTSTCSKSPELLTWDKLETRSVRMASRIRSRCGGLLECQDPVGGKGVQPTTEVSYLHRTVKDYLDKREVRETLKTWTSQGDIAYNPSLAMLKALILQIQAVNLSGNDFENVEQCLSSALLYARRLELDTGTSQFELLEELFATAYNWERKARCDLHILRPGSNSLTVSIQHGLHRYVGEKLSREKGLKGPNGKDLLEYAIYDSVDMAKWNLYLSAKTVSTLLDFGAGPKRVQGKIIASLLENVRMHRIHGEEDTIHAHFMKECAETISCLLRAGWVIDDQAVAKLRQGFYDCPDLLENALKTVPAKDASKSRFRVSGILRRSK